MGSRNKDSHSFQSLILFLWLSTHPFLRSLGSLPASLLISSYIFSSSSSLWVIAGIFTCKATVKHSSCVTFCLTPRLGYLKGVYADFFLYEVETCLIDVLFCTSCPLLWEAEVIGRKISETQGCWVIRKVKFLKYMYPQSNSIAT